MRRGVFDSRRKSISKITVDHPTIECSNEQAHQPYITPHGCAACADRWLKSLSFWRYADDDYLLKTEFNVSDKVEWYKKIIEDVWGFDGSQWFGYTVELFGYRLMDAEDPDSYPYWRIADAMHPKSIIPLVRTRICYEPQNKEAPIFLEIRQYGLNSKCAIRGMDDSIPIGPGQVKHLLRARNRLLNLSLPNVKRGGPRNVKVANSPKPVRRALGKRYAELRDSLTNVKRDAKTFASVVNDWQRLVLDKYPVLGAHPDLLNQIEPYPVPSDAEASDRILAPWEIAIEIAARETIPNYERSSVSSDALKRAAIATRKG